MASVQKRDGESQCREEEAMKVMEGMSRQNMCEQGRPGKPRRPVFRKQKSFLSMKGYNELVRDSDFQGVEL